MSQLVEIRRVTVVAETVLETPLIETFLKLGAKGYTCVYCTGKVAHHEILEDPYTGQSLVRIEVFARIEVAEAILDAIHKIEFKRYPVIGVIDKVEARPEDNFF